MYISSFHLTFAPLVPTVALAVLACGTTILSVVAILRRAKGAGARALALALMLMALANPVVTTEKREPVKDMVLLVTDQSASMNTDDRTQQVERAKASLLKTLAEFPDLEVATVAVEGADKTGLFQALAPKLATIPPNRLAGIIALTDGQVHDTPEEKLPAPLHTLLAGNRNEFNRKLVVVSAPSFAVVGKEATFTIRVEDAPQTQGKTARVTLRQNGEAQDRIYRVPVGKDYALSLPVKQAGANLFALEAEEAPKEISTVDNKAAVSVNGVRDRLRVLLVSGTPHIAARVWRGLLKADPAIDLLHFTILRTSFSSSRVPQNEMSLIAFPTRELFEEKLSGFDLVIFDRFSDNTLVPELYLDNIARYVRNGGALLISHATEEAVMRGEDLPDMRDEFESQQPRGFSQLSGILPIRATDRIASGAFVPAVTGEGLRHPVMENLTQNQPAAEWGPWYRQAEIAKDAASDHAQILMTGLQGRPLLALDRVGKGRVAQFLSDQFWLWSRSGDNAGPQIQLMRRVVHWLVQEPDLDETSLRASSEPLPEGKGWNITVTKRSLKSNSETVTIERPDGKIIGLNLKCNNCEDSRQNSTSTGRSQEKNTSSSSVRSNIADNIAQNHGLLRGTLEVRQTGIYRVKETAEQDESEGHHETLVVAGPVNAPEFADLRSTDKIMEPVAKASGGGVSWLADNPDGPKIHRTALNSSQSGSGWIGLRRNGQYRVTGSESTPLGPLWAILAAILAVSMLAWHREGR
ncbi:MAG: hypothetical protein ABTQ34_06265 [Bdellovibrionales bacterium]